jgi:hypothetical protein
MKNKKWTKYKVKPFGIKWWIYTGFTLTSTVENMHTALYKAALTYAPQSLGHLLLSGLAKEVHDVSDLLETVPLAYGEFWEIDKLYNQDKAKPTMAFGIFIKSKNLKKIAKRDGQLLAEDFIIRAMEPRDDLYR